MKSFLYYCTLILLLFSACKEEPTPQPEPEPPLNPYTTWNINSGIAMADYEVYSIAIDTGNNKWFATSKGLVKYDNSTWEVYTRFSSEEKNKINSIMLGEWNDSTCLWLATDSVLTAILLDESSNLVRSEDFIADAVGTETNAINRLVPGVKEDFWILASEGLMLWDKAWMLETTNSKLDTRPIRSAHFQPDGTGYCGRHRGGMIKFNYSELDGITGASEWVSPFNGAILDTVNYVFVSTNDQLWLACYGDPDIETSTFPKDGLIRHTGTNSKTGFTYFNTEYGGLTNNRVNCITEAADGTIWIATEGGISYQYDDNTFVNYTVSDGLAVSNVNYIAFDHTGDLWCATSKGISVFKDGSFQNFYLQ